MERYDGKTRRDDYIKYGLITLGVLVVLGLLIWFTGFMKARRQSNPDFTVVVASEEAFNQAMVDDLESVFSGIVGDQNGDGKTSIHIEVLPSGARSVWRTFPSTPVCWTMEIRKK